jgi:uncharacterized damage-inducible protein DinB
MDDKHEAFLENYRWLARYNRWFNARLYDACERLDDAARRQDRGAFFGSIHATLNHVLWGDRTWLGRLASLGGSALTPQVLWLPEGAMHDTPTHATWEELRAARAALDDALVDWTLEIDAGVPVATMRYANTKGVVREHPAWRALTHFFNHQAHHRGQVTTMLMQAGVDPGVTDLIAMPG